MRLTYNVLNLGSINRHCLILYHNGKKGLQNFIRDEICRFWFGRRFRLKINHLRFLSMNPIRDLLILGRFLPRYAINRYGIFLSRIIINFTVVLPIGITRGHLATQEHTTSKRLNQVIHTSCRNQGIGFEAIIFVRAIRMTKYEEFKFVIKCS